MNTGTTQTVPTVKKTKLKTDNLRVKRETKKKIQGELAVINRKNFGRAVTADEFVSLAITLLQPSHLEQLKDRSLSNKDRMEKRFQEYCAEHGKVSKDEFIGVLLSSGQGGKA
ncbi:hypothetical protein WDW86_03075 [Bdellovibrionota bacterium FG-2]